MCNVLIPASEVISPNIPVYTDEIPDLETQRFAGDDPFEQDLEGDVVSNQQFLSYSNQSGRQDTQSGGIPGQEQGTIAGAEVTGPVPQNPGYERLVALLENCLSQDWTEKGNPGNPRILQTYRVCNQSYDRDSSAMAYAWCAAYVSWALDEAGIGGLKSMSSQAYKNYGAEVGWRDTSQIRKGDVVVFKSKTRGGGHVGFIWEVDSKNQRFKVLGGNQGDNAKISNYRFESNRQYTLSVRRNWAIPAELDVPIDGSTIANTSGEDSTV